MQTSTTTDPTHKRALATGGSMKAKQPKKKNRKPVVKPAPATPTMQEVPGKGKPKGKLPDWLVKLQKKRAKKAGKVG